MSRLQTPKVLVLLLLALLMSACAIAPAVESATAMPTPEADTEAADTAGIPDAAFPVTIEHKFGSITIPAEPQRIVILGYSEQDPVLALGVVPVAVR